MNEENRSSRLLTWGEFRHEDRGECGDSPENSRKSVRNSGSCGAEDKGGLAFPGGKGGDGERGGHQPSAALRAGDLLARKLAFAHSGRAHVVLDAKRYSFPRAFGHPKDWQ